MRLRFIFFCFKIHYPSQFAHALRFQNPVLEILDKILSFQKEIKNFPALGVPFKLVLESVDSLAR